VEQALRGEGFAAHFVVVCTWKRVDSHLFLGRKYGNAHTFVMMASGLGISAFLGAQPSTLSSARLVGLVYVEYSTPALPTRPSWGAFRRFVLNLERRLYSLFTVFLHFVHHVNQRI
jgi:hypothetical protein